MKRIGQRIGLWGGSFNPPTIAHKALADFAFRTLSLNELIWLVSPNNPMKDPRILAPLEDRLAMVRLTLADRPSMQGTDIEQRLGSSYTINTVRHFRREFPGDALFWFMGTDNWQKFHLWGDDHEQILDNVSIVVFQRPGYEGTADFPASKTFKDLFVPSVAELKPFGSWTIVDNPSLDMAATHVRAGVPEALKTGVKSPFITQEVWDYIRARGLYAAQP